MPHFGGDWGRSPSPIVGALASVYKRTAVSDSLRSSFRGRWAISPLVNIKTDGTHEYRLDLMRRIMHRTGENTKAGAVDRAMEGYLELLDALEHAGEHEDMTADLAETLSTPHVELEYRVETDVTVR